MAVTSITDAIAAYANTARSIGKPADASETGGDGVDFASLLQDGAKAAIDAGKKSEQMSKAAITGKADIRELTLQTVVAVRDKVISAYNDILRMPI